MAEVDFRLPVETIQIAAIDFEDFAGTLEVLEDLNQINLVTMAFDPQPLPPIDFASTIAALKILKRNQ